MVVVECFRIRKLDIGKHRGVPRRRLEGPVRSLVLIDQEPGLLGAAALQKIHRQVGSDVGAVAGKLLARAILDEIRIEVDALARQHAPVVETNRVVAQVPLTDQAGAITGLLQQLRIGRNTRRHFLDGVAAFGIPVDVMDVGQAPGKHRGPPRRAEGIGDEAIVETHAFVGQPIEVRRVENLVAVAAHHRRNMVVGHDVEDIWALWAA